MQGYEHLKVWQKSMLLVEKVYELTERFSGKGYASLIDQMRRAAVSVPSNIAEGSMRHSVKDYARFIAVAQGSLAELETQLTIAHRLRFIEDIFYRPGIELAHEVGRMLRGLAVSLEPHKASLQTS